MKTFLLFALLFAGNFSMMFSQAILDFNKNLEKDVRKNIPKTGDIKVLTIAENDDYLKLTEELLCISSKEITGENSYYLIKDVENRIEMLKTEKKKIYTTTESENFKKDDSEFNRLFVLEKNIDSLKMVKDYLVTINSFSGIPKVTRKFVPLRSIYQASYFFLNNPEGEAKINFVKDISFISNLDGLYTLKSNILTGVVPLFTKYIPVKIAINSTVSQQANSNNNNGISQTEINQETSINKVSNGGLLNVDFTYPFFFSNWKYFKDNSFIVYAPLNYRIHVDDLRDGINIKETYYYHEFSGSFLVVSDIFSGKDDEKSSIFAALRCSYFTGSSKFSSNIGFKDFLLSQLNLGIKIRDRFIISGSIPVYSNQDEIKNKMNGSIGITFLPN